MKEKERDIIEEQRREEEINRGTDGRMTRKGTDGQTYRDGGKPKPNQTTEATTKLKTTTKPAEGGEQRSMGIG